MTAAILDRFLTADGQEMVLEQSGDEFTILIDEWELMSSRSHRSEEALAERSRELLQDIQSPRLLIGGLGMGFTLRAALDAFGPDASIEIAEVFEKIADWCRGPLAHFASDPLSDSRANLRLGDLSALLVAENGAYDAILLDLDNGPSPMTLSSNRRFYGLHGLARLKARLRPGGYLIVWSATPDRPFERRLKRSGFTVTTETVRADPETTWPRHTLFIARA